LQSRGNVPEADMLRTFNMGIGLIIACSPENARTIVEELAAGGEPAAVRIGAIAAGGEGVRYIGR